MTPSTIWQWLHKITATFVIFGYFPVKSHSNEAVIMFLSCVTRNLIVCQMFLVILQFLLTTCLCSDAFDSSRWLVWISVAHELESLRLNWFNVVTSRNRSEFARSWQSRVSCDSSRWLSWHVVGSHDGLMWHTQWHWGTFLPIHTLSMPISVVDTTPPLIVSTSWWLAGSRYVYIDLWTLRQQIESCRGSRAICLNQGRNQKIPHYWPQRWIRSRNWNLFYSCRYLFTESVTRANFFSSSKLFSLRHTLFALSSAASTSGRTFLTL